MKLFGGIEAGGTKFVCLVGNGPDKIVEEMRFPTTSPDETMARVVEFFAPYADRGELAAVGIASFGPVDLNHASQTYGFITATPKPGWLNVDVVGSLLATLNLPIGFDTDVNGAALGESRWGAAQGLDTFIYLTIGTGIGGGALVNGKLLHGLLHTEMGHISLPHDRTKDPFQGGCPFHADCFEGLAAGSAIEKRWGQKAETLPPNHPAWDLEAHYIAEALANYIYILSPQRIVIGGGVTQQLLLLPLVRQKTMMALNNYVQSPDILQNIETYIVPPGLGNRSGILGAIALAEQAFSDAFPNYQQSPRV
jgi:fructokinase